MLALVLAALALALFLSPAQAATHQIVLGHGEHPSVSTDGADTVDAVWATTAGFDESEGVLNAIGYCRWQVGARTCGHRQTLLVMSRDGAFSAPEITTYYERWFDGPRLHKDKVLVITDSRCCGANESGEWVLISRDEGSTWTPARVSKLGSAHDAMLHRAGMFEVIHPGEVDRPAGPSLTTIGGGFASFGFPVALDSVRDIKSPGALRSDFPGFADDGARRVYAEGMGLLEDGRPFAVGYPTDDRGGAAFIRTALPNANPGDVPGGWTPWQPLTLPRGRESVVTTIESVAWGYGQRPALLEGDFLGANDVLLSVPFNGAAPARATLIAADTGSPVAARGAGSLTAAYDEWYAVWVTQQEACPRGRRCLVFRKTDHRAWTDPKEVVRSVPLDGPDIGDVTIDATTPAAIAAAWTERRRGASGLPQVRLAWLCTAPREHAQCQHYEWREPGPRHNMPYARLDAPNLVSVRHLTARVTGTHIDRVRFTLVPPRCRPKSTGDSCFAFRRAVRIADRKAPFSARFKRLPRNTTASTIGYWQNRLCGIDAYLYRLKARVTFDTGKHATVWRTVSVCPPLT